MPTSDRVSVMQSLRSYFGSWRRRVEQVTENRRNRLANRSHQPVSAFQLESLEPRLLLAADLTGAIQSAVLPDPVLEGTTGSAVVTASNIGNQTTNRVDVAVYISQDTTLDGSDIQIGTASSGGGINAGKSKDFIVPFASLPQLDPGTYRLLAKVDSTNLTVENSEANNIAVGGTITVAWQFGNVPGKPGQTALTLRDADGTLATFSLTGPGTGTITKSGSLWNIQLTGTDTTTALTISNNAGGNGRLTLNDIHVAGALASFAAPTTDLLGALTVNNGPLPAVNAGTIAGGVISANAAPTTGDDEATTNEDTSVTTGNVLGNDSDGDNALTLANITGFDTVSAKGGTVLYNGNGTFTYTPKANFNGSDTFTYTLTDAGGLTATATVTINVTAVNDGPVAVADSVTTHEGQSIAIAVLGNDTDPDTGEALRILSVSNSNDPTTPTTGTMAIGSISGVPMVYYTPRTQVSPGQSTTDQFQYTIVDSAGATATATVTVTIVGVNNAPVAVSDRVTVTEETGVLTVDVLANDTDPDAGDTKTLISADGNGRPAQIVITSAPSSTFTTFIVIPEVPAIRGSVSIVEGMVRYDPTSVLQSLRAGETLTETIFYTMTDAAGATSSSTLVVTVTGANDGPSAVEDEVTIAKNAAPVLINILANDTDPDAGDSQTISLNTTGIPGLQDRVALSSDGRGIIYTVGAAFENLPLGETATETFTYTITDSSSATSTATVTVHIVGANTAPVAVADTADAVENGGPVTINVLANDQDQEDVQGLSVTGVTNTGLRGTVSIAPDGKSIIYTVGQAFQELPAGQTAQETFTYTIADALGAQSFNTVTVTVTGINDLPGAIADAASLSEDSEPVVISVLANDLDADADDPKQILSLNTTGLRGTATISDDGLRVMYSVRNASGDNAFQTLRAGQSATERFSYTMVDGSGATSIATVTVTVIGENDGPVAVADTLTVTEDATNVTLLVLANDTDADAGDTKTIVSVDQTGLLGTVTINGASLRYSAGTAFQSLIAGQTETESFTYTIRDSSGGEATATVTLSVTGVTDGPKAIADTAAAQEDGGSIVINVLANDTNDADLSDSFTITSIDGAGRLPSFIYGFFDGAQQIIGINPGFPRMLGTATIAADGHSIIYTAPESLNPGETLVDTFVYTMVGSNGGTSSAVVRVTVTGGVNDAPAAADDTANLVVSDGSVTINVLANDTDPDTRIDPVRVPSDLDVLLADPTPADLPDTKTIVSVNTEDLQGSVAIAVGGGTLSYTVGGQLLNLAFGQTATETFTYTMEDSLGVQSTAAVTVTIIGSNQAPVAAADNAAATENGVPVTINVLANDSDADVASGDSVSIMGINTAGLQGTASVQNGHIVYTVGTAFQNLRAGVTATETFTYTIQDNRGAQSIGTVTVTVTGANDGPVAGNDGITISEDAPAIGLNLLVNDMDLDAGDTKTIMSLDTTGLQGTATIAADGLSVIYNVGQAFQYLESGVALDTFTYTMRDSNGSIATARVTITVLGAPEAPPAGAIQLTAGDDLFTATAASEFIYGQAGDDTISAGGGADTVFGGAGRDSINGGSGNDIIIGGADRDDLTGGLGADTFAYALVSDSTVLTQDKIKDFSVAQGDKIDLRQIDANTLINGDNAFVISTGFTGLAGQLVLTQINGGYLVQGDVNGDRVVDFQVEVRTSDVLNQTNFLL